MKLAIGYHCELHHGCGHPVVFLVPDHVEEQDLFAYAKANVKEFEHAHNFETVCELIEDLDEHGFPGYKVQIVEEK